MDLNELVLWLTIAAAAAAALRFALKPTKTSGLAVAGLVLAAIS